jgi:uncharacterized RDD family membrane protein YckC
MKLPLQRLLLSACLVLALPLALRAQADTPASTPNAPSASQASATATPAPSSAPATSAAADKPAVAPAGDTTPAPAPAPASAAPAPAAAAAPTPTAAASTAAATASSESTAAESATTSTSSLRTLATAGDAQPAGSTPATVEPKPKHRRHASGDNARVTILGNSHLNKDEVADAVVAIAGNSESEGVVHGPVVAVAGNAKATGDVDDVVVAVLGNAYVDSRVGQVVAVAGNVDLGPNAEVMHDVVCVAGEVHRDPAAVVHGNIPNVGVGHIGMHIDWLHAYLTNCILKGRPLAIAPHLAWAWCIAFGLLVFYLLLTLLFGRSVERNCETLEQNPGASILTSVLTLLLTPIVVILLVITVVGIAVIPFLAIGLICATIFGRVVILAWLGRRLLGFTGKPVHPVLAVLAGGVLMLALYLVPFLGFVLYKVTGVLGLGVVVYSIILSSKREKAARLAAAAAAVPPVTVPPTVPPAGAAYTVGEMPTMAGTPGVAPAAAATTVPPPVALTALPRAGFWVRFGALMIDIILVGIVAGIVDSHVPRFLHSDGPQLFLVLLGAYAAVMWKLRATTVGGIVCGLRVVRTDGREIDWATAVVRAAASFLSLVVAFLGFIWVAFDDGKQSWHDKIAGTTVVHSRGGNSLV